MSSRLSSLLYRYSRALIPGVLVDYLSYFASLAATGDRFTSFVIGRFVGFITFYMLATHGSHTRSPFHFLGFFALFLVNILASLVIDRLDVLAFNALAYKFTLDAMLLLLNFVFFHQMQSRTPPPEAGRHSG